MILSFFAPCAKWRARQACRLFMTLIERYVPKRVEMRMVEEWHTSVEEARQCCEECHRRQWVLDGLSVPRNKRPGQYLWGGDLCTSYACTGNLDGLRCVHEAGHPLSEHTLAFAYYHGSLDCLAYAWENGVRIANPWELRWGVAIQMLWREESTSPAEVLACMIYLHDRGVLFTHQQCSSIHHQEGWYPGIQKFIHLARWCRDCHYLHDSMYIGGPWEKHWLSIMLARGRQYLHMDKYDYARKKDSTKLVFDRNCVHGYKMLCCRIPSLPLPVESRLHITVEE